MLPEREAAKYPFLKVGLNLLEALDLQLDDLAGPTYTKAVDRAKERVIEAIVKGEVSAQLADPQTELLSYPISSHVCHPRRGAVPEQTLRPQRGGSEHIIYFRMSMRRRYFRSRVMSSAGIYVKEPESIDGVMHNLK